MEFTCLKCLKILSSRDKRRKFCSSSCASSFNGEQRTHTQETKRKISNSLKIKNRNIDYQKNVSNGLKEYHKNKIKLKDYSEKMKNMAISASKGKYNSEAQSITDFSKRTVCKIIKRLNLGCSRCGWNEATCDLHHIHGRKILNADSHENLTILCPNCHRMFHNKKIGPTDVKNLKDHIGDLWKEYYFG